MSNEVASLEADLKEYRLQVCVPSILDYLHTGADILLFYSWKQ